MFNRASVCERSLKFVLEVHVYGILVSAHSVEHTSGLLPRPNQMPYLARRLTVSVQIWGQETSLKAM